MHVRPPPQHTAASLTSWHARPSHRCLNGSCLLNKENSFEFHTKFSLDSDLFESHTVCTQMQATPRVALAPVASFVH